MNEWARDRANERKNEWTNGRKSGRTNERVKEWTNERTDGWMGNMGDFAIINKFVSICVSFSGYFLSCRALSLYRSLASTITTQPTWNFSRTLPKILQGPLCIASGSIRPAHSLVTVGSFLRFFVLLRAVKGTTFLRALDFSRFLLDFTEFKFFHSSSCNCCQWRRSAFLY